MSQMDLIAEIEAFLRAARLPPSRPMSKCFGFDDQPARYTCPDCGSTGNRCSIQGAARSADGSMSAGQQPTADTSTH
jgi:hypothetical protein